MTVLYSYDGRKVTIQHPIDVITALNSGNYFEENPIKVKKVDSIAQKHDDKITKLKQTEKSGD